VERAAHVDANESVIAAEGTTSSVTLLLHPLVVINISEHFTRIRAQSGVDSPGVWVARTCYFCLGMHSVMRIPSQCRQHSCSVRNRRDAERPLFVPPNIMASVPLHLICTHPSPPARTTTASGGL